MGKDAQRCGAQKSPRPSAPRGRGRPDLRLLDKATMLPVTPPSLDAYHRISCREKKKKSRSDWQGPAELRSKADHENDEPPEQANASDPGVPPRQLGIDRSIRSSFPAIVRHPGDREEFRALFQGNAESFYELPQPSAAEAFLWPQVQGTDASRLGKPPGERDVQEIPIIISLEDQDTPAVSRALLHDPPHVFGRVEDRSPNTGGPNGIPTFTASSVTHDQGRSRGIQPSPTYYVSAVWPHSRWAYHRLVRLLHHTTSHCLFRHHSPTHAWLVLLTHHSSSWRP